MKNYTIDSIVFPNVIAGCWRLNDWNFTKEDTLSYIHENMNRGVHMFDHADIYGGFTCEKLFGEALALEPGLRERLQIVTKCGIKFPHPNRPQNTSHCYDTSASHILYSVEQSLLNFQTDYLDVVLIHRLDYLMDIKEVARVMISLVDQKKVRHFGVSNFLPAQMRALQAHLPFPLVTNQLEINPYNLENFYNGTLEYAQEVGLVTMVWSPLAGGELFKNTKPEVNEALESVRLECNLQSIDEVVYAWLGTHPANIAVIAGSSKIERIEKAIIGTTIHLTPEQWYRIFVAAQGHSIP